MNKDSQMRQSLSPTEIEEKIKKFIADCVEHGYQDGLMELKDPGKECMDYFEIKFKELSTLIEAQLEDKDKEWLTHIKDEEWFKFALKKHHPTLFNTEIEQAKKKVYTKAEELIKEEIQNTRGQPLDEFVKQYMLHADPDITDYMGYKNGYELGLIMGKNIVLIEVPSALKKQDLDKETNV